MRELLLTIFLIFVLGCQPQKAENNLDPRKFVLGDVSDEIDKSKIALLLKRNGELISYSMNSASPSLEVLKGDVVTVQYVGTPVSHKQFANWYYSDNPEDLKTIYTSPISASKSVIVYSVVVE